MFWDKFAGNRDASINVFNIIVHLFMVKFRQYQTYLTVIMSRKEMHVFNSVSPEAGRKHIPTAHETGMTRGVVVSRAEASAPPSPTPTLIVTFNGVQSSNPENYSKGPL